ncbi:MAG: hypothetical protein U0946_07110, partial [Patescibacteria group bacterium]|nr:hypothetical protein [Patescibacteria group bacterium]
MADKLIEKIGVVTNQIAEAVTPSGFKEKDGIIESVSTLSQFEILERARHNQALTPVEVKTFLDKTSEELLGLGKIPNKIRFNFGNGSENARERRQQLVGALKTTGIEEIEVEGENFSQDEVWDAVIYDARKENDKNMGKDHGLKLLDDARGEKIKRKAVKIIEKLGEEKTGIIYDLSRAVNAEGIDTLSINTNRLNIPKEDISFKLHGQQKPSDMEIDLRSALVVRKKLQRINVVDAFFNQRAEGRAGQTQELNPGEPQLSDQVSYDEHTKQLIVQGVPFSGDSNHLTVVEMLDVLEDGERMFYELKDQLLGGTQGRSGWIAEAILRRLNEVWTETSDIKQKAVGEIKTWVSQLGRGHLVAKFLEIPEVGRILAWEDWYQQRDPLTDRPLPIDDLPTIEARVKEKAKNFGIPTSKVDLALYLSRILQLGYWPGRVGYKHRVFAERYAFEDVGASLPIGFFPEEEKVLENMPRGQRIAFEAYIAELNSLVVGHLTDYAAEHLHRVVDNAVTEDILYRWEVSDAPIYRVPPDEVIQLLSQNQKIPFSQLKEMFIESYLHREQFRWLFVWARMGGLYKGWEYRIGEKTSEKQYLNPGRAEDRQALIDWLKTHDTALKSLKEAGIEPEWITDVVVKELFTNENMKRVNEWRLAHGGKVKLNSLAADINLAQRFPEQDKRRINVIATALEFVLRDKRTWGVDMGNNNDLLARPNLSREIRHKGGFASDEIGTMVVMEFTRSDIHDTWKSWLNQLSRVRLRNEFPDLKALFADVTSKFGDESRWRTDSAAAPYLSAVTALGIRSKDMMVGYWLAGYEATAGAMTTSQLHLSDVLDQMRILYWHKPVIGAYKRIYGRENHLAWMDRLKLLQRADLYNVLDTRWEQLFQSAPDPSQILNHLMVGGGGKAMYAFEVSRLVGDGQPREIILRDDPDYWINRYEHEARHLYYPATQMLRVGWEGDALQGKFDRDAAKAQIDKAVAQGLWRRWYTDEFKPIGLGDLFRIQFKTYVDRDRTIAQEQIFPIDFMIDLRQQARGVSIEFAAAHGFSNPTQFWELGKMPGGLTGNDAELWGEFRKMMLEGWLINVDMPESKIPQFYWQWREQALGFLGLSEEKMERIPLGGLFRSTISLIARIGGLNEEGKEFLEAGGGWAKAVVNKNRDKFIHSLQKDPVREELGRIEENYSKWVVEDLTRILTRANERGLLLADKVSMRANIEEYYRKGKIDQETRDRLLSLVIKTRYKPNIRNDIKDRNFWVNNSFPSIWGGA